MTPEREKHLIAQVKYITSREDMDAFRAAIRAQDETITSELFRALEKKADEWRGKS